MDNAVKTVLLGTAEVVISSLTGASLCAPVPPLALLMLPVCAGSSLISVVACGVISKAFNVDEHGTPVKFAIKSATLFVGTAIASGVCIAVLFPISIGAALLAAGVVALASVVGALATVIMDEAPEVFTPGYNSYSLNVGYGSPYYRSSYGSSAFSTRVPSHSGFSARGFGEGRTGFSARGFDSDRRY